jgi:hypothetical protein
MAVSSDSPLPFLWRDETVLTESHFWIICIHRDLKSPQSCKKHGWTAYENKPDYFYKLLETVYFLW